ncbi:hypothetical protein GCM10010363_60320 [Streptomyces omiyaensis]|uniref:hypothetical protein n=1 Tax=Streptomyces omiyaensis TaxID=68247 RepID=UPI001677A4A3|nr:hypothetical protein [Streptomyces omiyaensis]GGY71112.1 hypothetical protein GCM10010363_60320 [Streptomyces omiyaensis]
MTEYEPTAQARAAAGRATTLAEIARRRAMLASAWDRRALHIIAELLDIVALSLYEDAPTETDGIPDDARSALADAEETATETPGTGFPRRFGQYVTHPLTARPLETEPAPGCDLSDEDDRLTSALGTLHGHLAAAATEEVSLALLEAVFALHDKRADLAQLARS